MHSNRKPLAVIIKGNPDRMKGNELRASYFYENIKAHLQKHGFVVEFDLGLDKTCPNKDAAVWVGHSRGTGRLRCIEEPDKPRFAVLGSPGGAIAPDDLAWHVLMEKRYPDSPPPLSEQPPRSHFIFDLAMKKEVDRAINAYQLATAN